MEKHFGIKAVCFGTNLIYRLYLVICCLILILGIAMAFNLIGDAFQLRVNLPLPIKYMETGRLDLDSSSIDINFEEAIGKVHFVNTPKFISWIFWVSMSIAALFGFLIIYYIRKFVKSVRAGKMFEKINILILQKLSYIIIGFWLYWIIYDRLFYHTFVKFMSFRDLTISDNFSYHPSLLIIAASIWLFSYIIFEGHKISEEQKLTI